MMGINRIEELNRKRFDKRQEVEIFLNNLNDITTNRKFTFDIKEIKFELQGLIDKFSRDTINISILSEISSGKSTFLNALVFNHPVLESKIGETTAKIFHIKYGEKYRIDGIEKENLNELKEQIAIENHKNLQIINHKDEDKKIVNLQSVITLPNDNLKQGIELYDTPGFAAIKEVKIINLLKDVVSKSDATILLLDISQGIKESEHLFIRNMLNNIQINKRFIVLNKYDTIINEDDLAIKSKEEIEDEVQSLIEETERTLKNLQKDTSQNIETFHLSAKKALVAKIQKSDDKLDESRFTIFEEYFWKRITEAKDEIFEDNIKIFIKVKDRFNILLKKELKRLEEREKELKLQRILSLDNQSKVTSLERELEALKELNDNAKERKEKLIAEEAKLIDDILYMLQLNFTSELDSITYFQKLRFWSLKKRYRNIMLSVLEEARSYIIQVIEKFIKKSQKGRLEMDAIVLNMNKSLRSPLIIKKESSKIELNKMMDKVISRIKYHVEWNRATFFALLKHSKSSKDSSRELEPSYKELTQEIRTIQRACSNDIIQERVEREQYLSLVEKEIVTMKQHIEKNGKELQEELEEIRVFIDDIKNWIG